MEPQCHSASTQTDSRPWAPKHSTYGCPPAGWIPPRNRFRYSFTTPDMLLHACIRDNHITLLKSLLSKTSRTQLGVTEEGSSPLHLAVFLNSLPAVQALLDAGADPWLSDDTWYYDDWPPCRTPMLMAMSHGYREIVSCIWHHPTWTFLASTKADNCLRNAVCAGDPGILKDFLTWKTDWSQSLLDDVLNMAAQTWNASALRVIIHGVPFPYGRTALTRALTSAVSKRVTHEGFPASPVFEMGCLDQALAIEELIKAGADPDLSIYKGHTPLYLVAHVRESTFGLRALLENDSNPNLILWDGFTVLHMLLSAIKWFPRRIKSENIHEAAIRLLLQHGALPLMRGKDGTTPLHSAFCGSNRFIVDLVLSHCPGPVEETLRVRNDLNESLMHFAALGGNISLLEWLISQELNVNQKNTLGWTPLMCALAPEHRLTHGTSCEDKKTIFAAIQAARLLIAHGAETQVTTADGWAPLHVLGLHADGRVHPEATQFACELLHATPEMNTPKPITFPWHGMKEKNRTWDRPGRDMTLLHWAAEHGCSSLVKALIECGADVLATDSEGKTSVETALYSRFFLRFSKMQRKTILDMLWEEAEQYDSDGTLA